LTKISIFVKNIKFYGRKRKKNPKKEQIQNFQEKVSLDKILAEKSYFELFILDFFIR